MLPARNEQQALPAALDALAAQVDGHGSALPFGSYEILLLLNNCTDASARVATRWKADHPHTILHILEHDFAPEVAHVGSARRALMDTAWCRLARSGADGGVMLSTDADTEVAPDWIAQNLRAIRLGADAVGGAIHLKPGQLETLPEGARACYLADRTYQALVAEFESLLDPQSGDPWPRHLEHFGASLACTAQAYAHAGGLAAVSPLEDVAFVDALRVADARLRHDPEVRVYTSARLSGRAKVGLSGQLYHWQQQHENGEPHRVLSAAWLAHRFTMLRGLRRLHARHADVHVQDYPECWRERLTVNLARAWSPGCFLREIDCDRLIEESFTGSREEPISPTVAALREAIARLRETRSAEAACKTI